MERHNCKQHPDLLFYLRRTNVYFTLHLSSIQVKSGASYSNLFNS
jgi:hypothetical protein